MAVKYGRINQNLGEVIISVGRAEGKGQRWEPRCFFFLFSLFFFKQEGLQKRQEPLGKWRKWSWVSCGHCEEFRGQALVAPPPQADASASAQTSGGIPSILRTHPCFVTVGGTVEKLRCSEKG